MNHVKGVVYSVNDAARIFDLAPSRLRYWAQTGLVGPSVRKRGRAYYTFRDLVRLKVAVDLLAAGLSVQRVRQNLESLRRAMPEDEDALTRMRIRSDGETVVAAQGDVAFEPTTGQTVMAFEAGALSDQVAEVLTPGRPGHDPGAAGVGERDAHEQPGRALARTRRAERIAQSAAPTTATTSVPATAIVLYEAPAARSAAPADSAEPATRRDGSRSARADGDAVPARIADEPATEVCGPPSGYRLFLAACRAEDRGDTRSAEAAYRHAIELEPTLAAAHTNLGNLLYRRGDAAAARACYETALALEPLQAEARYNLGNVLEDAGEIDQAIDELTRVCRTSPGFADAHYNLGLMLARVGSVSQAKAHLERFVQLGDAGEWTARARGFLSALG